MMKKSAVVLTIIVFFLTASVIGASPLGASAFGYRAVPLPQKDKEPRKEKEKKEKKSEADDKEKADSEDDKDGRPALWEDPGNIENLDMVYGPGGREGSPETASRFTFIRRSTTGTSEKIIVSDEKGREWTVKFGSEPRPETAATRFVWAAGYHVDQDYFLKHAHIEGRGGFDVKDVRFERRKDGYKDLGIWSWHSNPFMGTRELQGLKVLMALLNNWDLKDINNKIAQAGKKSGVDRGKRIYYIADLGATFGSTGSFFSKLPFFGEAPAGSKGDPEAYAKQSFIEGTHNGQVVFHYKGKNPSVLEGVTVENAKWMGNLIGRLSDKQINDAFRSAGFSDADVLTLSRAFRDRVNQLKSLR